MARGRLLKNLLLALATPIAGSRLARTAGHHVRRNVAEGASAGFPSFDTFTQMYHRTYKRGSAEYEARRARYEGFVADGSAQNSVPGRLWTARVSGLWDWSDKELAKLRGLRGSTRKMGPRHSSFLERRKDAGELPETVSWSNLTSIQQENVKDQGACGSCWAIAATTVLEAHFEHHRGSFRTFSTQQLVSCVANPLECGGSGGCTGATVELAMEFVEKHGLPEESEVPYVHDDLKSDAKCPSPLIAMANVPASNQGGKALGMQGWSTLPQNKEQDLASAVANMGPVAVSIAAGEWYLYGTGVFNGCKKDAILDHAVTLIGYGYEPQGGVKYWHIQNSWGKDWGEQGTMRIIRHSDEEQWCGTDDKPELGSACKPYPESIRVCGSCGILYDSVVPHFTSVH